MKKLSKILFSPITTVVAFVLAASLLLLGSINGARAALTYYSETYASRVQMFDIGVTLKENGANISWRDYGEKADGQWDKNTGELLANMLAEGEKVQLGKTYQEELNVRNSGTINQYVRVTIYKYWVDENGTKLPDLSPDMIDLHLVNLGSDWIEDETARTAERTVLYYNKLLKSELELSEGETNETPLFADKLTINSAISRPVLVDGKNVYAYNGAKFIIEAKVDAVQENNAEDAVLSAWGKHVTVNATAGTLALQ